MVVRYDINDALRSSRVVSPYVVLFRASHHKHQSAYPHTESRSPVFPSTYDKAFTLSQERFILPVEYDTHRSHAHSCSHGNTGFSNSNGYFRPMFALKTYSPHALPGI